MALVREDFGEGRMAEESMCKVVVLIPKGKGDYENIGLVEVVWKSVAAILPHRLTASITYHDFFHGFWSGCGTCTATPEAKLLQKLVDIREEVLCVILPLVPPVQHTSSLASAE